MAEPASSQLDASILEKLTPNAVEALSRAEEEAAGLSSGRVRTAHVLLGVLETPGSRGGKALNDVGVTAEKVRDFVARLRTPTDAADQRPYSHGLQRALTAADEESRRLQIHLIGTEHVLLGLVRDPKSSAAQTLATLDVTPDGVRAALERYLDSPALQPENTSVDEQSEPAAEPSPPLAAVPTHGDRPARDDELGRVRLAEILAERMRRIRGEDTELPAATRRERRAKLRRDRKAAKETGSFLIHVHAPWGAGKSSLLNFLGAELRNLGESSAFQARRTKEEHLSQWIVADFSAWEHQRLEPPWWWLLAAMRRSAARELWKINRGRWLWFRVRDAWWHLWNARATVLALLLAGGLLVLAWLLNWFGLEGSDLTALKATAVSVTALIAFVTLMWGRIRGTSTLLAFGSAAGAVRFMRRSHDPLGVYRRRFSWLVRASGRPMAVIVDDLDRCKPEYVVALLEGIQTLFADQPVTFVVAADRTWLCQSFATSYGAFDAVVGEPGRPLGYLFLEKTFQVSMEIPPMSPEVREQFWGALNRPAVATRKPGATDSTLAADAYRDTLSLRDVEDRRRSLRREPNADQEAIDRGAVRRLNAPELQARLEDDLSAYADLLENNPRAMKRLLNSYGIERDRLLRENDELSRDERRQLVLFAILRLRWPQFAEYLLRYPGKVKWFEQAEPEVDADHVFRTLFFDDDVRRFFGAASDGVSLDADVFIRYAGGKTQKSSSVGA
jgi:KAP family P-loop domain/Clp amino terminal domain, pathogenicity island component